MSNRKTWGIMAAVAVLTISGSGAMIYFEKENIVAAQQSVTVLRGERDVARKTIEGTSTLEREVIVLRELTQIIETILPNSEDVNNLIRTFHEYEADSGVQVKSYKRQVNRSARKNETDFDKVSYLLTLEGDLFQFLSFMDRIETHARFMAIPSFKLTAATRAQVEETGLAKHKINIDVETYRYEPKKSFKPVDIEAYERKRDLLAGEVSRRRQALTLNRYTYRGARGRRDPWIDPRVPANVQTESSLSVQEQMELVDELAERMTGAQEQWGQVVEAQNVLAAMISRRDLEETLAHLEEALRRIEAAGSISYVPAQKRLRNDVYDPLDNLRQEIERSTGTVGPSREMLTQVYEAMGRHIEEGEYGLAIDTFHTIQNQLGLIKNDPARQAIAEKVRRRAEDAETLRDFGEIELKVGGVALIEGFPPSILINGKSLTIGDMVNEELEVLDIRPNEIDFYFRGVILTRVF